MRAEAENSPLIPDAVFAGMKKGIAERVDLELQLATELGKRSKNPFRFVRFAFPWGQEQLRDATGPRAWQKDVLERLTKHLGNPETRHTPFRLAVASGHGVGKSALVAMITNWALTTCEDARVTITANTESQLRTKTWPEVMKWHRLSIAGHWFTPGATSIISRERKRGKTWRADTIPWSENNTEAFSGLHNLGKRIVVIFDEASAIADSIWDVTEGALTDINTEIIWLVFGNPTKNTGRFRECFGSQRHRWQTLQVDSRDVEGATNKEQIKQWIEDYGDDSDFVRIRVKGQFPRSGTNQFIPNDVVAYCRKYKAIGYEHSPKIMSVDVARFGDDRTVIGLRQGRKFTILTKLRGASLVEVTQHIIMQIEAHSPNAVIVDSIGLGAGVVDQMRMRGYGKGLFEYAPKAKPFNPSMYVDARTEMWGRMRDALTAGMEIPDDPEVEADLCGPEFGFNDKSQLQLERKEDMISRGLASPDTGDCMAMSFAVAIKIPPKLSEMKKFVYPGQMQQSWMQ